MARYVPHPADQPARALNALGFGSRASYLSPRRAVPAQDHGSSVRPDAVETDRPGVRPRRGSHVLNNALPEGSSGIGARDLPPRRAVPAHDERPKIPPAVVADRPAARPRRPPPLAHHS